MHPTINFLGRAVPTYSLCIIAGITLAVPALIFLAKQFFVKIEDGLYSFIYSLIGLLIGAKLFFLILNAKSLPSIVRNYGFQSLFQYGFVIYGGLAGAFLGAWIYCRQFNLSSKKIFSLLITVTPLIQCLGRLGCFFAGCCYGLCCNGRFSIDLNGVSRFPIQIVSSLLDFLLFIFLLSRIFLSKHRFLQFPLYLICYSTGRFFIEFFRGDSERGFFFYLSTSQWISLLFFMAGCHLFKIFNKNFHKSPPTPTDNH